MNDPNSLPEFLRNVKPHFKPTNGGAQDSVAAKEANKLENDVDLEKDGKKNEHNRTQSFKTHFHLISVIFLWFFAFSAICAVGIWVWHLLSPCGWLKPEQITKIEAILGSAIISSAVTKYVQGKIHS